MLARVPRVRLRDKKFSTQGNGMMTSDAINFSPRPTDLRPIIAFDEADVETEASSRNHNSSQAESLLLSDGDNVCLRPLGRMVCRRLSDSNSRHCKTSIIGGLRFEWQRPNHRQRRLCGNDFL